MFRNVLVGVDGLSTGRDAVEQAIDIAARAGGRLGLLAAAPPPSIWASTPPFAPTVSRSKLAADIEAEATRHVDEATRLVPHDLPVTKLVVRAGVVEALLTQAHAGPWDLVVVGRRRDASRFRRDVGARISRSCPVPVMVVPLSFGTGLMLLEPRDRGESAGGEEIAGRGWPRPVPEEAPGR